MVSTSQTRTNELVFISAGAVSAPLLVSAERTGERLQGSGPVPAQPDQRAAEERRHPGPQVEPAQGAVQGGALEQDGGAELRLQDGAAHGRAHSLPLAEAPPPGQNSAFVICTVTSTH